MLEIFTPVAYSNFGQLIKGGGFLVSTKGKIISTTGDAISSLGRHIAASAVIQAPKPHYGHPTYGYDHRPIEHDNTYDGPPPHIEDYPGPANNYDEHSSYPSASDGRSLNCQLRKKTVPKYFPIYIRTYQSTTSIKPIIWDVKNKRIMQYLQNTFYVNVDYKIFFNHDEDRSGQQLVKPTKTEQNDQNNKDHLPELDQRHPNLQDLENSFGGPPKGSNDQNFQNSEYFSNDNKNNLPNNNLNSASLYPVQSQGTYNSEQVIYNNNQLYQLDKEKYSQIYQNSLEPLKIEPNFSPNLATQQFSIQQSLEYPAIHLQQIQYSFPEKDLQVSNYNDLSSLHTNLPLTSPQFDTLKISMLENQKGLELPKLQPQDFNALPTFSSVHIDIATQEPLTLPVLNPINAHYWPSRGLLEPTINIPSRNLIWRRSNMQRKKLAVRSPASLRDRRPFRV
ncbi:hypothetical protein HZH68_002800 [Vespula germanica]|uniref:Uncharacterized protein n=1 Tax=Vespula germanica TaxID=30212 RepID=A0A834U1M4_VESGE|nr:hypothetical protein HZH68_002800 [Vespula germanica]